jgi:hypothetical protein
VDRPGHRQHDTRKGNGSESQSSRIETTRPAHSQGVERMMTILLKKPDSAVDGLFTSAKR